MTREITGQRAGARNGELDAGQSQQIGNRGGENVDALFVLQASRVEQSCASSRWTTGSTDVHEDRIDAERYAQDARHSATSQQIDRALGAGDGDVVHLLHSVEPAAGEPADGLAQRRSDAAFRPRVD